MSSCFLFAAGDASDPSGIASDDLTGLSVKKQRFFHDQLFFQIPFLKLEFFPLSPV